MTVRPNPRKSGVAYAVRIVVACRRLQVVCRQNGRREFFSLRPHIRPQTMSPPGPGQRLSSREEPRLHDRVTTPSYVLSRGASEHQISSRQFQFGGTICSSLRMSRYARLRQLSRGSFEPFATLFSIERMIVSYT